MNVPALGTNTAGRYNKSLLVARLARWLQEKSLATGFAITVALLVFVSLVGITEMLSSYRRAELASERRATTLAFAAELRASADRELNSVLYLASGLVGYLVVRRDQIDGDEINNIMAAVFANSRHVRNFSIAVGYRPSYVYPLAGNEKIIGSDYREIPEQWPAVQQAIESRKLVLTGPVKLLQGGTGLIYRTPIYIKDSYWGLLATVIDMQSFQNAAFGGIDHDRYDFAVRSVEQSAQGGGPLWGNPELFADRSALRIEARVPNGTWIYAVRDKQSDARLADWAIRVAGWLLALLTALCVGLLLRQRGELAHNAGFDSLTGLPNRRLFDDRLEQAFRRHTRDAGTQIAVLFMDLNGFKPINDAYGHKVGDAVLNSVALRVRDEVRIGDTVARWAGDEFVIIIEDADEAQVSQLLARLRQRIAAPCTLGAHTLAVSAAIGAAFYPRDAATAADLLELADRRMYQDKGSQPAG